MSTVLILEDEEMLRSSMMRGIQKLPHIDVVGAGTLDEALILIDKEPPSLILSDLDLPDRPGVELLGELGKRALKVPIVFISAYVNAFRPQIPAHGDVEVREKPVSLDELRNIVQKYVTQKNKANGGAPFSPADYIQIAAMGRHSVTIEITSMGKKIGTIIISSGQVWSASDKEGEGESAFTRLVFSKNSAVACKALEGDPGKQNINKSWEALLLDSARYIDEKDNEKEDFIVSSDTPVKSTPEGTSDENVSGDDTKFYDNFDKAIKYLLEGKHDKALPLFLEAKKNRPDDPRVETNLKRLAKLGFSEK